MFGMARIGIPGHDAILEDTDKTRFSAKLAEVTHHTGRVGTVGFLHCVRKPGKFKRSDASNVPPAVRSPLHVKPSYAMYYVLKDQLYNNGEDGIPSDEAAAWDKHNKVAVEAACVSALPRLRQGKNRALRLGRCWS